MFNKDAIPAFWRDIRIGLPEYGQKLGNLLIQAVLLVVLVIAGNTLLLYFCKSLWYVFTSTLVGNRYVIAYPQKAGVIFSLFNQNLFAYATHVTLVSLAFCLAAGFLAKILQISRSISGRSFFFLAVCYGLPLTIAVTAYLHNPALAGDWYLTLGIALVPTLALFRWCFVFFDNIIPDPKVLFSFSDQLTTAWEEIRKSLLLLIVIITAQFGFLFALDLLFADFGHFPGVDAWYDFFDSTAGHHLGAPALHKLIFSFELSVRAFLLTFILAVILQIAHIALFLLEKKPPTRFAAYLPVVLYFALNIKAAYGFENYTSALALCFLPVMMIFKRNLYCVATFMPEGRELKELALIRLKIRSGD